MAELGETAAEASPAARGCVLLPPRAVVLRVRGGGHRAACRAEFIRGQNYATNGYALSVCYTFGITWEKVGDLVTEVSGSHGIRAGSRSRSRLSL